MASRPAVEFGTVLVTGGSGGLASQILALFSSRKCGKLHSIDIREPARRVPGVDYHMGDLTDPVAMRKVFEAVKPDAVIHVASPRFDAPKNIMYKVNVEGTKVLVKVAQEAGTKTFVYTSSASVVSDGETDLINADETYPLITGNKQPEFYTHTKAVAETHVLQHNRTAEYPDFRTCALRPSGIFGVGDLTVLPGMLNAFFQGRTKVQLGNNDNLFEFTENTNVAHAHYLAVAALAYQRTSQPNDDTRVDGEAFFITNDEPIYFWDFTRTVWGLAGDTTTRDQIWTIPRSSALVIAGILEWVFWLLRLGEPPLSMMKVRLSCMTRYYSVEKAKARLGYEPQVSLRDGLKRGVPDCIKRMNAENSRDLGKKSQ
nr:sterol-4-alpha-carboxylate 3-dehydrogenase, decarboxylating [Quercus suber]